MGETLNALRSKYPQYDDIPDAELADQVLTAHPVYHDTDLLQDAMPVRAKKYGEIKEAPSLVQTFVKDIVGGAQTAARGVAGLDWRDTLRGVGTAINAPFRALGGAAERVATEVLPESVQDRRGYDLPGRLGSAVETWSAIGTGGVTAPARMADRGVAKAAARTAAREAPVAPAAAPGRAVADQLDLFPGQAELPLRTPQRPPAAPAAPAGQQLELSLGSERLSPGTMRPRAGTQTELPLTVGPEGAPYPRVPGRDLSEQLSLPATREIRPSSQGELFSYQVRPPKLGPVEDVVQGQAAAGARPSLWRRALTGLKGSDFQEFKLRMKAKAGSMWLPEDVARGNPVAEGIVRDAYSAHDIQRQLARDIEDKLKPVYGLVKNDPKAITRIHRALDGQAVPLSPAETQAAIQLRGLFDSMADMAGVPKEARLADYFPHLRDEISSVLKVSIKTGGKPVGREIPQEYRVFFEKSRRVPGSEGIDFGLPAVQRYVQAMSRRVAMKGGRLPDGSQVEGFLNRVGPKFEQLPEINEYRAYFRDYVSDLAHGYVSGTPKLMTPQMASTIKKVEFLRTIGYNVTSPIHNVTQTLNTFAKTDPRSWAAAWYDIVANPKMQQLARKHLDLTLTKADIEILANPNKLDRALDVVISGKGKAGFMFAKAEELNRMHAFSAGYRDAVRMGLKGDDAVRYAVKIVDDTQFRFGMENTPTVMRRSELAGVVGQFKKFQLNQAVFLKNLVLHDPKGFMKWVIGTVTVGGTELPGVKQVKNMITEALGGDPDQVRFRGLLGEMGIYLGNQIGLGALPIESVRDLAFALPGPALAHITEVASVLANKGLSVTDMAVGRFGETLSPDEWASRLVRLGSVQANRIRQALVQARTEGANLRAPRTAGESFGLTPPTGAAIRPKTKGVLRTAIGVRSPEEQEYGEARGETAERVKRWNQLKQQYNEARNAGDADAMEDLQDAAESEFNRRLHGTKAGAKGARERAKTPGLERQLKAAPKELRRQLREEVTR